MTKLDSARPEPSAPAWAASRIRVMTRELRSPAPVKQEPDGEAAESSYAVSARGAAQRLSLTQLHVLRRQAELSEGSVSFRRGDMLDVLALAIDRTEARAALSALPPSAPLTEALEMAQKLRFHVEGIVGSVPESLHRLMLNEARALVRILSGEAK